jgi:MFS family permease
MLAAVEPSSLQTGIMSILKNRNFVLHWICVAVAATGGFLSAIALPWLVLSISKNNPLMMSGIIALSGLPYAIFILFGGALTDRFSPLRLLFITRSCFALLMLTLAVLVYHQITPYWMLAIFALLLGLLNAFGVPASESLLPSILPANILGQGNGIIMVTMQVSQVLGPMLAGWILWLGRTLHGIPLDQVDYSSLAGAFGLNALTTIIVLAVMSQIRPLPAATAEASKNLFKLIFEGMQFCWNDRGIRTVLAYLCLISFFVQGPLAAILPVLTKVKLGLSEAEYGNLYGMLGMGTILGAGLAMLTKPNPRILGRWILCCDACSGLAMVLLGYSHHIYLSCGLLLLIGTMNGFIAINGITWFQQRTPDHYMGRIMSILMFAILGLVPVSATLTGYLIHTHSLELIISTAGGIIIFCAGGGLLIQPIRRMGQQTPLRQVRQAA